MMWKNIDINQFNLNIKINSKYITIYVYQILNTGSHLFKGSVQFNKRDSVYCFYGYGMKDHIVDSTIEKHIETSTLDCLIEENIAIKNNKNIILSNSFLLEIL